MDPLLFKEIEFTLIMFYKQRSKKETGWQISDF